MSNCAWKTTTTRIMGTTWNRRMVHWTGTQTLPMLEVLHLPSTNSIRIADTVEFFPTMVSFPWLSSADNAFRAATELIDALKNLHPAQPFAPRIGTSQTKALQQLADIFQQSLPQGISKPPTAPGAMIEMPHLRGCGSKQSAISQVTTQHQCTIVCQQCGLIH
jgi:hypothetical protein